MHDNAEMIEDNLFYDDTTESEENENNEEDNEQINIELHDIPNNVYIQNDREDRRNEVSLITLIIYSSIICTNYTNVI